MTVSDWEHAYRMGWRVFYEIATVTLRQCPENYCLAIRHTDTNRWFPAPDKASTINAHSLGIVLDQWQEGSTGAALAEAVEEAFWGPRKKG